MSRTYSKTRTLVECALMIALGTVLANIKIQVAKLAGVPDSVIERAKELVEELVSADITTTVKNIASENKSAKPKPVPHYDEVDMKQMSLFDTVKDDDVLEELKTIQLDELRPVDALNLLYQLQNKLKNRW